MDPQGFQAAPNHCCPMRKFIVFVFLLGFIGAGFMGFLASFGHFKQVERDFAGRCDTVSGLAGPEDLVVDPLSGLVFVSSLDRRSKTARGGIYRVDPLDPLSDRGWRDATAGEPEAFRPAGLDFFGADQGQRLFVVNEAGPAIEIYEADANGALSHLKTVSEKRLTSPNNIAAVSADTFYVTNDVTAGRHTWLGAIQFLTRSKQGQVLMYRDGVWSVAADGLQFANGVALSADQETLYVSESAGKQVRIFDRDPETGALTPQSVVKLPIAPDNLSLDADGSLWIAGMPKPLALPGHERNPGYLAPSEVMRLAPDGSIDRVYADDGSELSASSTAAHVADKLMVGAIYDSKFLLCELPQN